MSYYHKLDYKILVAGFPLVSVLMNCKTEALYDQVFVYVALIGAWHPGVVTSDFVVGLQNSMHRQWKGAVVMGCWFHSANVSTRM